MEFDTATARELIDWLTERQQQHDRERVQLEHYKKIFEEAVVSTVKINPIHESILSEAATAIFRELEQFCGERLYVNMDIDDTKPQRVIVVCPIPPEEEDYFNSIKVVISVNKEVLPHMIEDDWFEGIKDLINDHLSPEKVESFLIKRSLENPMPEEIWYEGQRRG